MHNPHGAPRRARFSLRTLMLVMVVVALGVAQFVVLRRMREVEARNQALSVENAKLRAEAGFLSIEDRHKVAVLQLRELDELTWRWKVFLPKGNWVVHEETRNIPQTGLTRPRHYNTFVGDQEVSVAASVRKGADGQWALVTDFGGHCQHSTLGQSHALVTPGDKGNKSNVAGSGKQETLDPDKPIVLLRLRARKGDEADLPLEPVDGLLIWMERKK